MVFFGPTRGIFWSNTWYYLVQHVVLFGPTRGIIWSNTWYYLVKHVVLFGPTRGIFWSIQIGFYNLVEEEFIIANAGVQRDLAYIVAGTVILLLTDTFYCMAMVCSFS